MMTYKLRILFFNITYVYGESLNKMDLYEPFVFGGRIVKIHHMSSELCVSNALLSFSVCVCVFK